MFPFPMKLHSDAMLYLVAPCKLGQGLQITHQQPFFEP